MLQVSEFDGLKPYSDCLLFESMNVPSKESVYVVAESIKTALSLDPGLEPVKYATERWNEKVGDYAETLRRYSDKLHEAAVFEESLQVVVQQLRAKAVTLKQAFITIKAKSDLHEYFKKTAENWVSENKRMYGVRYRPEAYIVARTLGTDEGFDAWHEDAKQFTRQTRKYLMHVDRAYADVMRQATRTTQPAREKPVHIPRPRATRTRNATDMGAPDDDVQDDLTSKLTQELQQLSDGSDDDKDSDYNGDALSDGDSRDTAHSEQQAADAPKLSSSPDVRVLSPKGTASAASRIPGSGGNTKRPPSGHVGHARRDKLPRRESYKMRDDNLSTLRDETRPISERLRASNELLQALPSAITKLAPHSVSTCKDTTAASLRDYINQVRRQLEANTDQDPVWFYLYYNKLPANLQTAVHQHFAPTPVPIVPFETVADHIRRTYLSGEVLVTVLQEMRTRITFDPKQKGAVTKFSMEVRLARDQLKDQFKDAINDFTILGYINEWMGTGHWFAKEFNKYLLNKPITWENISEALVLCTQQDALHEANNSRDPRSRPAQPFSGGPSARLPFDNRPRHHPYSNPGFKKPHNLGLPAAIKHLQATINNFSAQMQDAPQTS
jgi:hypothetical protein